MIHVESRPDVLRLFFRDRKILEHTPRAPALALGAGVASYGARPGSSSPSERIERRKEASRWELREASAARAVLAFPGLATLVCEARGGALELRFEDVDPRWNRLWISICAGPRDHVYGGGGQRAALDRRGQRLPIWVTEPGGGRGLDLVARLVGLGSGPGGAARAAHFAQPTFVTSQNLACHIDAGAHAELDFRDPRRHTAYVWQIPERIRVDVADRAPELLGRLSAYLGRQPELPAWTYEGAWLGVRGGAALVDEKLARALGAGAPIAAVWARDWAGVQRTSSGEELRWNWRYDRGLYPNLPQTLERLREGGIRFLGYINPMLVPEGDLYHEAEGRGFLVRDRAGRVLHVTLTSFPAAIVDLENPEAARWYRAVIRENLIDLGMSGWMADLGEALPPEAALGSGRTGAEAHNEYPARWARVNREAVEEAGKLGDVVFFMRAGFTGSSRWALAHCVGDPRVDWSPDDGFPSVIQAAISLGFAGVGHVHADVGGAAGAPWRKRGKELFLRWCEQAAFTPILRTHEGDRPDENWQFDSDEETLAHFARMARIYAHLGPYHRAVGGEHAAAGLPSIRHPYLHYEGDEALHGLSNQYLYGPDLLVAPVLRPKERAWSVVLPDDEWVHAWTGRVHGRGAREVPAPVGQPPVFYRRGSPFRDLFEGLRTIR